MTTHGGPGLEGGPRGVEDALSRRQFTVIAAAGGATLGVGTYLAFQRIQAIPIAMILDPLREAAIARLPHGMTIRGIDRLQILDGAIRQETDASGNLLNTLCVDFTCNRRDLVRGDTHDEPYRRITIGGLTAEQAVLTSALIGGERQDDLENIFTNGTVAFAGIVAPWTRREFLIGAGLALGIGAGGLGLTYVFRRRILDSLPERLQRIFIGVGNAGNGEPLPPQTLVAASNDSNKNRPIPPISATPTLTSVLEPISTPTIIPTETPTPTLTVTPTREPTATATPLPLENLGPPVFIYTSPVNKERKDTLGWYSDGWVFQQEDGGKISVVDKIAYPDFNSPYAPTTDKVLKFEINENVPLTKDTFVFTWAEGSPIKGPFSVTLRFQISDKMRKVVPGFEGYNGLLTLWSQTKANGSLYHQFAAVGIRNDMTLDFGGFHPDGSLNFSQGSRANVVPDKYYELNVRITAAGYGYAFLNGLEYAEGQLDSSSGVQIAAFHAGAHTKGVTPGGYVLNGPVIVNSWAK